MAEKEKKSEGPSCACGKVDLYEEMLKNEKKQKEASEATTSNQTQESSNSTDSDGKEK